MPSSSPAGSSPTASRSSRSRSRRTTPAFWRICAPAIGIPLAAGQNEGLAFRFRDLLQHRAVDILQPNVVIGGGFTQCLRIAGMAAAFNVPIANGGAWPFHNMHLHAGLANGGLVEYHYPGGGSLPRGLPRAAHAERRLARAAGKARA